MMRQFSAGGVVYKKVGSGIEWLIRLPKANPGYKAKIAWTFCKGWIDEGENPEEAALREVREEGGIKAKITDKLSTIKIFFTDAASGEKIMKFITYFVMSYESDTEEGFDNETQEVRWVSKENALQMLAYANEKQLLKAAYEKVV